MARILQGIVTSDKRDKTITVSIASRETHPLYRKQYTKTRKYTAHDEKNDAHTGDKVEIAECRPFSKTVCYNLVKVLERAKGSVELKDEVLGISENRMTEQGNESKEDSQSSLPNDAVRTALDSEGGKR